MTRGVQWKWEFNPRVAELVDGRIAFATDDHPWAPERCRLAVLGPAREHVMLTQSHSLADIFPEMSEHAPQSILELYFPYSDVIRNQMALVIDMAELLVVGSIMADILVDIRWAIKAWPADGWRTQEIVDPPASLAKTAWTFDATDPVAEMLKEI